MMKRMIRKQVHITPEQAATLKRIAAHRGVSESEMVRQGIVHLQAEKIPVFLPDARAWEEAEAFMRHLQSLGPLEQTERQGRTWTRDGLNDRQF